MKHFHVFVGDFRTKVLPRGAVWGAMTSLISTEHDSDRGRAKIMAVAFLDYKRYFSNSERTLLAKLSTFMRQKCGSENRQVLEAYLHSQRNTLQEFTLCEKLLQGSF
mmetsp:Transcript_1950/g.2706  ORF Transcript_1950/g.2706 Transcript_1950/m.2706 type:complete len:107 (-) Transcript_1950:441-761(-)